MATRELNILIQAKNMASRTLGQVNSDINKLQSTARRAASNIGRNLAIGGAAAAGIVAVNVKAGLESLAELERVEALTAAVLKSTGSAAAGSAEDIRARSEALEQMTAVDDKVIQNAQNLLLTFRNVSQDAFEPALQAALDLNATLGGDDQSLQGVLLKVGAALNDPVRGLAKLTKAGVTFDDQQREQIKTLQESGDMLGAQAIILEELNKQTAGAAAAGVDTYAGKMKLLGDAVEGAQMALATAFLPVLEKVSDKIQTFLSDEGNLQKIEDFGGVLAEGFDDALSIVERIPWDAVGATFGLMGTGARTVLQMFTSLPPWVQTAVLTGWGLNKLSGGGLGSLVGQLGSGLIKGVLGMNAGVVNIKAGTVVGGGGGGAPLAGGGGGRGLWTNVKNFGALAAIPLTIVAMEQLIEFIGDVDRQATGIREAAEDLDRSTLPDINKSIDKTNDAIDAAESSLASRIVTGFTGTRTDLEEERRELVETRNTLAARIVGGTDSASRHFDRINTNMSLERSAQQAIAAADAARINSLRDEAHAALGYQSRTASASERTAAKDFSPTISVGVNNFISVNGWLRTVASTDLSFNPHIQAGPT